MKENEAVIEAIRERLEGRSDVRIADLFGERRAEVVARLMGELSDQEVEEAFEALWTEDAELAIEVLPLLDRHDVSRVVNALEDAQVAEVVEEMPSDDATYVLELLPDDRADDVVAAIEEAEHREELQERLEYPEDSAGRLMSREFVALPQEATAGDAIKRLQEADEAVMIGYVYLTDPGGRLAGVVSLRSLLRVKPERKLSELSPPELVHVSVQDDQEHVAQAVAQHDFVCIPVLDEKGRLAGVVTHDDVLDVLREEATEDMLHMAGTSADDVITQSVWNSVRLRMPWLLVCLMGGVVNMTLLSFQEERLGTLFIALMFFMPVIVGMGGNVGTQAATIVVRGLATGRIRRHDSLPVFWRELRTAVVIGLIYGGLLGTVAWQVLDKSPLFCIVVGLSLVFSMVMASAFGSLLPVALQAAGVDPAVATGPLVTTAMDMVGILVYLTLAGWMLLA